MPKVQFFNTLSRKKEEFKPINPPEVSLYTCGPTVYDFAHIGNLRTYLFEDVLRRTLVFFGYRVRHVMNITDVGHLTSDADEGEDKLEKGARREGRSVWELATFYTEQFFKDTDSLKILRPHTICKATDHIEQQIAMIQELDERGFVYDTGEVLYFDTSQFKNYGKLAKLDWEKLQEAQSRVDKDPKKKNPSDFALWFRTVGKHKNHIMKWPSPWGEGFPGWHIECSAMSTFYLGKRFDIHCGGIDHIPVHHTNEIAQSEAIYGSPWVKYWLHGEFLLINKGRMGKSQGNFLTLKTLADKGYHPLDYRYFTFNAHYRTKLSLSWEALDAAKTTRAHLHEKILGFIQDKAEPRAGAGSQHRAAFSQALADDMNIPEALAAFWAVIRDDELSGQEKLQLIYDFDQVLGLNLSEIRLEEVHVPTHVQDLIDEREIARKKKDFKAADLLRKKIESEGYLIADTPAGIKVRKG